MSALTPTAHALTCTEVTPDADMLKDIISDGIERDSWPDAKISCVLEYLYANKHLCLTEGQRLLLHNVVQAFNRHE